MVVHFVNFCGCLRLIKWLNNVFNRLNTNIFFTFLITCLYLKRHDDIDFMIHTCINLKWNCNYNSTFKTKNNFIFIIIKIMLEVVNNLNISISAVERFFFRCRYNKCLTWRCSVVSSTGNLSDTVKGRYPCKSLINRG